MGWKWCFPGIPQVGCEKREKQRGGDELDSSGSLVFPSSPPRCREGNAAGGETEAGAASRALLAGGLVQIIYFSSFFFSKLGQKELEENCFFFP